MKAYGMTDIGKKRVVNQDNIYVSTKPVGNLPNLFVVADGMGGHKAGDYASRYATDAVVESISANSETDIKKIITKSVEDANSLVFKESAENEDFR